MKVMFKGNAIEGETPAAVAQVLRQFAQEAEARALDVEISTARAGIAFMVQERVAEIVTLANSEGGKMPEEVARQLFDLAHDVKARAAAIAQLIAGDAVNAPSQEGGDWRAEVAKVFNSISVMDTVTSTLRLIHMAVLRAKKQWQTFRTAARDEQPAHPGNPW
ncbi:MAG: hypothetical protein LBV29_09355 [Azoarcus sp.]|nr:hypothetical protein [Azoarcus sp.]